ncbi:pre-mRNA 3'-end-processing factor FIP1 isoform X2 [Melanotaenia boesemani]|uniref:pre-mRNA 3'-end-processing factor FIP1 isoform X2 n=1 Tax=Melanotaenia boesemani TaxID=1250792 RepID=UPI001C03EB25|nr:pre-mRNA 3'-end-processing factor FIP1 isoform X2 [Melanotaenia boesemani]
MSESGSESTAAAEKREEERLYEWLFDLHTYDLKEEFPYSTEHSPVHPEMYTEMETCAADPAERQGMTVSKENTTGMKQEINYFDTKPWMRPGAKISDYFNYGFDEATWSAYCKKQNKLQAFRRNVKITAQKMPMRYREKEPCCSYSSSARPSIPASRESSAGNDVSGGRDGCSSAAEEHPCLSDGANNTQVVTEMSHKHSTTAYDLMPPPVTNKSLFAFLRPPASLFQPQRPSPSSSAALGSEHNQGFDGPSTSLYQCFSASSPVVSDATKSWKCDISHGKCSKDRNRSRSGDHDKEKNSCRDREKQQSSSSSHNRDKKQKKRRKATKHEHKHPGTAGRMMGKTGTEDTKTSKTNKKAKKRVRKRN